MTVIQCETCGRPTEQQVLCPDGNIWHILCPNCASQLNSCAFCKKSNICSFETDPSPLPKMIQKQIRQGSVISVITEKNLARVDITGKINCDCFSADFGCMRQFHYCERIDHVYDDSKAINTRESKTSANNTELHSEIHE